MNSGEGDANLSGVLCDVAEEEVYSIHRSALIIAHRRNTVLQSDRIMVFESGRLREFDAPRRLCTCSRVCGWIVSAVVCVLMAGAGAADR